MPNYEQTNLNDGDWQTRHVAAYFKVHPNTIARWRKDVTLNFPHAVKVRGRLYWDAIEVKRWRKALAPASGIVNPPACS